MDRSILDFKLQVFYLITLSSENCVHSGYNIEFRNHEIFSMRINF